MSARRHLNLTVALGLALVALAAAAAPAFAGSPGLVAAYSFDEGSGEIAADDSGNGHQGTITGATWTEGKHGTALKFEGGEEECVTVANSPDLQLTEAFTLEAWIKPEGTDEFDPVIFKEYEEGWYFTYTLLPGAGGEGLHPAGATSYEAYSANTRVGEEELPYNAWSHLSFVFDGEDSYLYVNGELVDSGEAWGMIESEGVLRIGCTPIWEDGFTGKIDDVRIYDRALSAGEVAEDEATPVESPPQLYWGAWLRHTSGQSPFEMEVQDEYEELVRKSASLIHWSSPFEASFCNPSTYACDFQTEQFEDIRERGSIPFFSWAPNFISWSGEGAPPSDREIAEGAEDEYIAEWAKAAKAWGHPFFLRFSWEMNGSWFRWGVGEFEENGEKFTNTASDYVAMWRHVHEVFEEVEAENVTWVWCPNIDPGEALASMSALYPGDEYVDWTCLDGYNWDEPWASFDSLFKGSYDAITGSIAPSKPMVIGETASTETGGSKAEWIADMFSGLESSYPKVHGLQWFDVDEEGPGDWPIESSTAATEAFASGIQGSRFAPADYGSLETTPIPATP